MRCGEQCFLVTYEVKGEQKVATILARTPVEARKKLRGDIGADADILAVKRETR